MTVKLNSKNVRLREFKKMLFLNLAKIIKTDSLLHQYIESKDSLRIQKGFLLQRNILIEKTKEGMGGCMDRWYSAKKTGAQNRTLTEYYNIKRKSRTLTV